MPDPWNKLLAILTPGIGYLAGHGLDVMLTYYVGGEPRRERLRILNSSVSEVKQSIKLIERELLRVRRSKNNEESIEMYEQMLTKANKKLAITITELTGLQK